MFPYTDHSLDPGGTGDTRGSLSRVGLQVSREGQQEEGQSPKYSTATATETGASRLRQEWAFQPDLQRKATVATSTLKHWQMLSCV